MSTQDEALPPGAQMSATPMSAAQMSATQAAFDRSDFAGAAAILTAHLAAQPDDIKALTLLAHAQQQMGLIVDAAATLERLIALAPARVAVGGYRMLAKFKFSAGAFEESRAVLTRAIAVHPRDLDLRITHACQAADLARVCAELEDVVTFFAGDPYSEVMALKALVSKRAHFARQRAGLPHDALSWEDNCAWPDSEGLERFRQRISALNKQKPRPGLAVDAACVAICRNEWDLAGELLDAVRTHAPGTLADYTAFGSQFHAALDHVDHATITRLLPPVHHILTPPPQSGETVLFGSDPIYFARFTQPFIAALEAMQIPADVQIHVMGGGPDDWRAMAAGLDTLKHVRVGFSAEDPGPAGSGDNVGIYCHAIRFVRQYLEAARQRRPMWALDVDGFVQRDPRPLLGRLAHFDVSMRSDPVLLTPPARVAGNLVGIAPTPLGLEYARRTAAYIMHWKERGTWGWGVDQTALHSAYAYMHSIGQAPKTHFQNAADVSNADHNDAVFSFPTGIRKFFAGG